MRIAGVEVSSADVVWLADQLIAAGHNDTAAVLLRADGTRSTATRLHTDDRDNLLQVLEDPPEQLAELRAALTN